MAGGRKQTRARRKPGGQLRIAVCIDTREGPGRERLLGCYQYALEKNWRLHLFRHDNENEIAQLAAIDLDGAIVFDRSRQLQETLKGRGVVCVETGGRDIDLSDAAIFMDEDAMARMAIGHLRSAGFENFGYCGIAGSHPSSVRAVHFLEQAGAASRVFEDQWRDGQIGISSLMRWLGALPKPTGVMTYNDIMGERVLAACHWANLRVPDEVGVIGLGNDELICEVTLPRLSSVALPARWIGRAAAETLERLLAGGGIGERCRRIAPLEVISRGSTDRLPKVRPAVLKAVEFMRAESHRPIGTDQVAAAVGVPRRTLDWAFSADMGRTVHDYFVELRMQTAQRLLRQTDMPLVEVSRRSGYASLPSFMRMFAARTGKPPREYREQYKHQHGG